MSDKVAERRQREQCGKQDDLISRDDGDDRRPLGIECIGNRRQRDRYDRAVYRNQCRTERNGSDRED